MIIIKHIQGIRARARPLGPGPGRRRGGGAGGGVGREAAAWARAQARAQGPGQSPDDLNMLDDDHIPDVSDHPNPIIIILTASL